MSAHTLSPRSSTESLQSSSSTYSIPDKLAPALSSPMAWEGAELDPAQYIVELSRSEVDNIRAAVVGFKLQRLPRSEISQRTFPLAAELTRKLSGVSKELHHGPGVVVLRGLEAARFNDEEAVVAFAGVCSYVARERATDSYANQTLSHVRDATKEVVPAWAKDIGLAGSKITAAMDFHSDRFSGDILAMHVRNDGGSGTGGGQYVASFWKIYNELLRTEPGVLETMAEADWPFELKQKNQAPHLELGPTLFFSRGKPICQLVKAPLLGSPRIQRDTSMPKVSDKQMYSMHVIQNLATRLSTKLDRKQGDIQFINNLSIMHAREAYQGTNGKASTRHLLRMFLRDPGNAWEKPSRFRNNFDDPFTPGRSQQLPIIDMDPWRAISGRESHG
ncbi:Clavaminate synthase-like protein [Didymella exigua CBS 183.55]|uniref:Clavaminate synthase-like protein n=1 Tax=Didymella exigua CBS 183.55 TaxID=1150837 RepID=A0A6A5RNK3_9PLEO|nr:Clavaminate synthase-like protein [Didymella exigua CBS 183.55]KAF1929362.1 Clavaminate synthase-like protein [Didymella exigua CBS 183.55]